MAYHLRKQVREAMVTLLTGLTTTGSHVFKNRLIALKENQLPALVVTTNEEEITTQDAGVDAVLDRRLSIELLVHAKAVDDIDDELDLIALEVESKVFESEVTNTLNGLISSLELNGISNEFDAQGEKKAGLARMSFTAIYFNQASAPDVSI